ncbi:uncharacterized protein LOC134212033 [Armigeres subalbatus]|uniref:uncharacterized protein LOC134212033 n=1 Tax=Armigeres subalbatus TaxID=124917 RepID=UPI002ED51D3F
MDYDIGKHCSKCDRSDTADNLVGCDNCDTWVHFGCAGVTDSIADPNRSWKCDRCSHQVGDLVFTDGRSSTSRRSARADLNLKLLEEQKAMRTKRILEEEAAQAFARRKIAEEEENFLKQKYAILLAEADDAEDGASRRSRLSSRASREKVRSWLSGQEVGASKQFVIAPSSSMPAVVVFAEAAQPSASSALVLSATSTTNAPDVATTNIGNVPSTVATGPASTSTPNSAEATIMALCGAETNVPGKYVSCTEISINQPPVSTPLLPRCDSPRGVSVGLSSAPVGNSGSVPSIVTSFPPKSSLAFPTNSIVKSSSLRGFSYTPVVCNNGSITPYTGNAPTGLDSLVTSSVSTGFTNEVIISSVPHRAIKKSVHTGVAVSALSRLYDNVSLMDNTSVGTSIPISSTNLVLAPTTTRAVETYPVSSQNSAMYKAVLSSDCSSTWINNKIISTGVSGVRQQGCNPVPCSAGVVTMPFSNYGMSTSSNAPNQTTHSIAPVQMQGNAFQPTSCSAYFGNSAASQYQQHQHQPQEQQFQQSSEHRGPSSEQLAARQVMPRELPMFSGDPQEWPLFYSSFRNSTEACGFSDAENLARLQRCLQGNALEAVRSRLLMPQSVPYVINVLQRLYGRPGILIHSLLRKLRAVPSPKAENLHSQITFGLAVQNVVDHMSIANLTDHLENPTLLYELVEKLPPQLKMQWSYFKNRWSHANLATFSAFMSELVVMASDVTLPIDAKFGHAGKDKPKLFTHSEDTQPILPSIAEKNEADSVNKTCLYCAEINHEIANCAEFKELEINDRWKVIKQRNLCRSCLIPHRKWPCRARKECGVDGCEIYHHKLLHTARFSSLENPKTTCGAKSKAVVHQNMHSSMKYSLFRYLPVTIHGNGQQIQTYAFLDDGSSSTLLESSIASSLGIKGPTDCLSLTWTGNISREEKESQRISVVICGEGKEFILHNVRTVRKLRLPTQTMEYDELQRSYQHLKGLPVRSYTNASPGIIIGIEHVKLLTSLRVREGRDNEPVASKTRLGWCIYGKSLDSESTMEQPSLHLDGENGNRELHLWMKQFFAVEESTVTIKPEAEEDKRARLIMQATTRRVNEAYETGLLWKYDHVCFPDSYPMALRRKALEKKLNKNPALESKVKQQISEYESKGYAHRITPDEIESTNPEKVWYLPLGIVQNPKKPSKLRLIWDAKARVDGVSFNDMLLKGPDLLVALMAVLLRFRQRNIAIVGDIKEMFHQIHIRNEDKQSQRFIFRDNPESKPEIYIMDVATLGATCSPSLAQFVKNINAREFAESYPRAASAIIHNHYVDDFLDSVDTEEEAVTLVHEVKHIHSHAGFEIRNFSSNSTRVLNIIGECEALQQVSMNLEKILDLERVLGLIWQPKEDIFTFDLNGLNEEIKTLVTRSTTPTKRQVLRTVMSLFDPLGLISHFVVHGKILMQQIWRSGTAWDDPIAVELHNKWKCWCEYMLRLNEVAVPRCFFKGVKGATLQHVEAHLFVDASEEASAAVLYFRLIDNSTPRCALVAAKTKVAPLKPLSIPRLELQAAMIGTRLLDSVLSSLDFQVKKRFLWSDSSTVLSWLRSDSRRYHQFVAFRVGEILTSTSVDEWHYVPSKLNAADKATKWKDGPSFDPRNIWYSAPEFLYKPTEQWPKEPTQKQMDTEIELRAVFLFHRIMPKPLIDVSRFSNWHRLLRTAAYVLRAVRLFKGERGSKSDYLSQKELHAAECLMWRQIQSESYPDESTILQNNQKNPNSAVLIPKCSPLHGLSPFIDKTGVIRMNSRIIAARTVSADTKYPILLPKNNPTTHLLVENYHRLFLHANGETVCNEMRQKFHIPGLRNLIRRVSKQCWNCRVRKATPQSPMMAPLPEVRVTGFVRPFTHTGVDYFGPIQVKQGRCLVKRWVALFTCLTVRAIHVELAHNLSTQSCIMAIRRFVARRGSPKSFYSDNGTNFVGASNILAKQIKDINEECAVTFTNSATSWEFNPPSAPHMGGSWERMVRSIKTAMSAIANHQHHPSDEVLQTVATEAEAIVNSRPLTYVPLDSAEQEALTPNHFLLFGTRGIVQPATSVTSVGNSLRDSWRLAHYLVDQFWGRWIREYLPTITRRTKWFDPVKPLEVGDLVLVVEENKRNGWLRGRIVEVTKASDGQVRRAIVQTKNGFLNRPAVKIAPLDLRTSGRSRTTRAGGGNEPTGHIRE